MPNLIPSEEFEKITDMSVKLNILFSYISDIYIESQTHWNNYNIRFKKLENRRKIDTTFSGVMGLVGGGIVWLGKTIFGK